MDKQQVIICDENGKATGEYFDRLAAHSGEGRKHLAMTVLLINSQEQVLLQKRKHRIFDNFWDLTGATDLLHQVDGNNETYQQATRRCLKREYYISDTATKKVGGFSYFNKDGKLCENEYCYLMLGIYDEEVRLNKEVGYEYKWVSKKDFLIDIKNNPQNYTPWAKESVKLLQNMNFFS